MKALFNLLFILLFSLVSSGAGCLRNCKLQEPTENPLQEGKEFQTNSYIARYNNILGQPANNVPSNHPNSNRKEQSTGAFSKDNSDEAYGQFVYWDDLREVWLNVEPVKPMKENQAIANTGPDRSCASPASVILIDDDCDEKDDGTIKLKRGVTNWSKFYRPEKVRLLD